MHEEIWRSKEGISEIVFHQRKPWKAGVYLKSCWIKTDEDSGSESLQPSSESLQPSTSGSESLEGKEKAELFQSMEKSAEPKSASDYLSIIKGVDISLLPADDAYLFGLMLLDLYFTKEELSECLIFPSTKSSKHALDQAKVRTIIGQLQFIHQLQSIHCQHIWSQLQFIYQFQSIHCQHIWSQLQFIHQFQSIHYQHIWFQL
eukprot:Em0022g892a